ncbi:arylsulfatase [Bacteroidota bacterium]
MRIPVLLITFSIVALFSSCTSEQDEARKPNIIVILTDDLGYGDVSCYGATEINTPNIDQLAGNGIRFTQGYCAAATCTPSRYALLTGQYPWKNKRAHILPGDAPLIMEPGKTTIPSMLKNAGYKTAVVGKWHLGMGSGDVDWNKLVSPGANDVGFEYSYLLAATQDRVPTVILENQKVKGLSSEDPIEISYKKNFEGEPTGREHPEMLKMHPSHGHDMSIHNGISRIGYQRGGKSALWVDEDLADVFTNKAKEYINEHKDAPFFLYFALHQPHVPRTPHSRFVGKSGMGPRGDAIIEADWCVGEIVKELKKLELDENTLIVFSSDNGPVVDDGYKDDAVEKLGEHTPGGPLRGGKYSLFDAGTRVPFIVSWPGTVKPGVSDALVSQIDLLASFARLTGQTLTDGAADSEDLLDALTGKSPIGREELILEARGKNCMRTVNWYFIPPNKGVSTFKFVNIESGYLTENQLYSINDDVSQLNNVAEENPEVVADLEAKYRKAMGEFYQPFVPDNK